MLYALILTMTVYAGDRDVNWRMEGKNGIAVTSETLVGYSQVQCEEQADKWRGGQVKVGGTVYGARCILMSPLEEALLMRQLQQTIPSDKVK